MPHGQPPLPPPPPPLLKGLGRGNGRAVENSKTLVRRNLIGIQEKGRSEEEEDPAGTVRGLLALLPNYQSYTTMPPVREEGDKPVKVSLSFYRHLVPIVQEGPSCGLAALCMALNFFHGSSLTLYEVLEAGRRLGFTKQGEMFSAFDLLSLATHLLPCTGSLVCRDIDVDEKADIIIKELKQGNAILIPYDKDSNHEPCLKRGHKAHWALLTGFLIIVGDAMKIECLQDVQDFIKDGVLTDLYHVKQSVLELLDFDGSCERYVYAFHGQSLRCRLWSLQDLLSSNAQLVSLSPEMETKISNYTIPQSGVEAGLCGQFIIIKNQSA